MLNADAAAELRVERKPVGDVPFSPTSPPISLRVTGRKIPEWQMEEGSAGTLPRSPVLSTEPDEPLTLVPYGSAQTASDGVSEDRDEERNGVVSWVRFRRVLVRCEGLRARTPHNSTSKPD